MKSDTAAFINALAAKFLAGTDTTEKSSAILPRFQKTWLDVAPENKTRNHKK